MSKIKASLSAMPKPVKIVLWVLLALLAYALPLLEPPFITTPGVDFGGVLFVVTMYMLVALGLNIVVGYAGLLDLGYVGFYAVGAYTAAILTSFHANWPLLLALPVAVLASTVSGVLLGAPTLRVRGDYLAIVTLGFGEIIRLVAVNTEWLGAAKGISNIARPPSLGGTEGLFEIPHLYWATAPCCSTRRTPPSSWCSASWTRSRTTGWDSRSSSSCCSPTTSSRTAASDGRGRRRGRTRTPPS